MDVRICRFSFNVTDFFFWLFSGSRRDEGEEQERGEDAPGERECRVHGVGQTPATAVGHHQPIGQSLGDPVDHELLKNETRLPER